MRAAAARFYWNMASVTIQDVDELSFERDVLQRSHEVPVVVDFWAAWCAPCRALGPVLERLAEEADGAWALAKVDVDRNPGLASFFGVQGIPAVRAFKDGREVGQFTGALPEAQVRRWLEQLGPSRADQAFDEGARAEAGGDAEGAASCYRRALDLDPGHAPARAALARVELEVRSASLDEHALRARVDADPADVEAVAGLADLEASRGRLEEAFDRLLAAVRVTAGEPRERARLHLLGLLDTVPPDDARAVAARRALSLALF
jgi:putative thioredoxin